ncbi:HDL171Wp [Eremothecium sinecaudum]|uniref:HDL171Wp n=1 Tax=Eremothecium sinecaudum TaxID=45286 RepID=A0A0X8HSG7_9SACH|nr:HDL171Wp [Eremothecium sinecaudum]AMD20573.1 HDL171Wp [Eremothecium sinecaudum]
MMQTSVESPSKDLSEHLEAFHITSPNGGQERMGQKKQKRMALKSMYKRYTANKAFPGSQLAEESVYDNNSSYVKRLSNWSMSYGTVQVGGAKVKENIANSERTDEEEEEEAQWKHYRKPRYDMEDFEDLETEPNDKHLNLQTSDLVVTTSLSDISLIPTNTFKQRGNATYDHMNGQSNDGFLENDTDDDPALAAKSVFDKVLRHQKSNFLGSGSPGRPRTSTSDTDVRSLGNENQYEDFHSPSSSSSFNSHPCSPSPPGLHQNRHQEDNHVELKLIRPEDAGMVFHHERGVWEPLDELELRRRSSVNIGILHSLNNSKYSYEDTGDSVLSKNANNSSSYPYQDDTPLGPPRLAEQFKFLHDTSTEFNTVQSGRVGQHFARIKRNSYPATKEEIPVGNITDVNSLDTSFSVSQSAVVRILLDVIPDKQNWSAVDDLDLSHKNLESLLGLDHVAPNCSNLNVSKNDLNTLKGVPSGCLHLCCSHNYIGTYASLNHLPHLETLNLSFNKLKLQNLSLLEPCRHLKVVDLSHNSITSLRYLPSKAHILKISLANNNLSGVIDFQQLRQESNAWSYIEELDLSGNKITAVTHLSQLSRIRILRLDGNLIKSIEGGNNAQIRTVTLTNNPNLHTISGFPALRILKCRGESLQLMPDSLPESLETLEIAGSSDNSADQWNWPKILPKYLRNLKLRKLQLSAVPPVIQSLPLRTLDLTFNCLINTTQLIKSLPPTLQELNLLGNPLWAVNDADRRLLVEAVKLYLFALRGA